MVAPVCARHPLQFLPRSTEDGDAVGLDAGVGYVVEVKQQRRQPTWKPQKQKQTPTQTPRKTRPQPDGKDPGILGVEWRGGGHFLVLPSSGNALGLFSVRRCIPFWHFCRIYRISFSHTSG